MRQHTCNGPQHKRVVMPCNCCTPTCDNTVSGSTRRVAFCITPLRGGSGAARVPPVHRLQRAARRNPRTLSGAHPATRRAPSWSYRCLSRPCRDTVGAGPPTLVGMSASAAARSESTGGRAASHALQRSTPSLHATECFNTCVWQRAWPTGQQTAILCSSRAPEGATPPSRHPKPGYTIFNPQRTRQGRSGCS